MYKHIKAKQSIQYGTLKATGNQKGSWW